MSKRKVDNRVRILIENGVSSGHRTLFVIVGDKSREQVIHLHQMLSKTTLKQAPVLWCYKKELSFSSHRMKRTKKLEAKKKYGYSGVNEEDPLEMFVSLTEIRYCYYKETHKILGNTYKMCVIQDFEALTPNILCRTIETVEGGGIIVILLQSLASLKQLYTLNMDVHSRYRTEAHQHVVPRFNERFILSLPHCCNIMVLDDLLRILPISSHLRDIEPIDKSELENISINQELKDLKMSTKDTPPLGTLVGLCKTFDQAKAVLQFVMTITEKKLNSTVTLTAARGRGKSAAMGIALAGSIAVGYSNIYITAPSPENLNTFFEFVIKGLKSLGYEEHLHYQVVRSTNPQHNKAVMRIHVTRDHKQIIQYISPSECDVLSNAELLVIDEAAAIPLPHVQALLGPYLVFMASTISGYEGTGRSLSLKLIKDLRKTQTDRKLVELDLKESIRYKNGDPLEKWLYDLLCLESSLPSFKEAAPSPEECNLFYVNRDVLFSYHKTAEKFLNSLMSLLVSSHYRNTPDDLQTLSDAPAHHLFVLLPPKMKGSRIPSVLCVIQVALEGKISKSSLAAAEKMACGRPSGDLIPWTISNVFQNQDFPQLSGARIVRIATHPEFQGKGYGSRALNLLEEYYQQTSARADFEDFGNNEDNDNIIKDEEVDLLKEAIEPRTPTLPLFSALSDRPAEPLHYLGVSYGISEQLLTFWKRLGFSLVYLSQVSNFSTGEHSCVMLKILSKGSWLAPLWLDFKKRLIYLLAGPFRKLSCKFSLSLLTNISIKNSAVPSLKELQLYINDRDLKRLDKFNNHQVEAAFVMDILPRLALLYFLDKLPNCHLKPTQAVILCGLGLQQKRQNEIAEELNIDTSIVMSQTHKLVATIKQNVESLLESLYTEAPLKSGQEESEIAAEVTESLKENLKDTGEETTKDIREAIKVSDFIIKSKELETFESSKALVAKKRKKLSLKEDAKIVPKKSKR